MMKEITGDIKTILDKKASLYNVPSFIKGDPVQVPHQFSGKENMEIGGLIAALLAWGQREVITRNALDLINRMDGDPADFIRNMEESDLIVFEGFRHRTFNAEDARFLVRGLRRVYLEYGGLSQVFREGFEKNGSVFMAIEHFRNTMLDVPHQKRNEKHLASPASGSAAKRINMYLRWMVRKDDSGVDMGLWNFIPASALMLPLDIHTGNVARYLGLLKRRQNDWKAVEEISGILRELDPEDPVRYDYALFGMGFYEAYGK